MKKIYTSTIILLSLVSFGQTPISLISAGFAHNEDFNGMGSTQTNFIEGWTAIRTGGSGTANEALPLTVSNGSASNGGVYNVGTTASEERALGLLADATTIPAIGAVFVNNSGSTATKLAISTRMEQWKESGNASVNETLTFSYSLDATSLTDGTWTTVTALDLNEKLTAATTNLAVNGDISSNYNTSSSIISGISWANGTNLWIKWTDANETGANGMYAIDNFSISISEALGVKQNTIAGLNMYPNPVSKGTLHITSDSNEAKSVVVFDVLGKQVLDSKTSNSTVNVSALSAGSYFVKITEDGKTDTKKLIVE